MKTDAGNSESNSAGTSANTPVSKPADSRTEAEFLQHEAARAKAAIGDALSDLGRNLKAAADPHVLTRDHPWVAISAAAVAGFAAAITLIPSKEQQALRALAELERARHASPPSADKSDKSAVVEEGAAGGLFATIAAEAIKVARPLLTTLITSSISRAAGGATANPPTSDGNGHAEQKAEDISSPS